MAVNNNSWSSNNSMSANKKNQNSFKGESAYPPLEDRLIEDDQVGGAVNKLPALSKRNAESFPCVQFYMPRVELLSSNDKLVYQEWEESMNIYRMDLIWLLKLPQYKFWSFLIFSKKIANPLLSSFLLRAPRPYDIHLRDYQRNEFIWPLFSEIYGLVFRVFLRICVFKESKADHITPSKWGSWLVEHNILDISKIFDLCALYSTEDETDRELTKMMENVFKHESQLLEQLGAAIPVFMQKLSEPEQAFGDHIRQMTLSGEIDEQFMEDLLAFQIDSLASIHGFVKHFPESAKEFHRFPQFELRLAAAYGSIVQLFGGVVAQFPTTNIAQRLHVYRQLALKIYRMVLTETTIYATRDSSSTNSGDEFLDCFTSCVDEKVFIYDYTKAYPFLADITYLADQGISIDETRIEYLMNAIAECWRDFGDDNAPEFKTKPRPKKSLDPLDDPDFDRQLLGACSLDVTGVEFTSLVTTVKDLFNDLPTRYIEACLKHYGYSSESVINAILESSVPSHLDEYRNEPEPVTDLPPSTGETFHRGKWSGDFNSEKEFLDRNRSELKTKILESLTLPTPSLSYPHQVNGGIEHEAKESYVDESLLPTFNDENEYEDEYDDTYDEVAVGSTEPENWLYNPLNSKADENETERKDDSSSEEDSSRSTDRKKLYDDFVEDPAIVRERMERRRQEKMHQRKSFVPDKPRDVVGKAKGQGQEKDVVLNRRHKEIHSNQNRRRGADRKRREF
ncbi:unnamed protein product [Allacma fusca]|uniref:CUE domain-containing protein n=1 Tax=Allacma fusca TaxID=39272 RepID=A0A8J2JG83_9HEXA|nr:unnamed protein product [Allacma fusca]